MRRPPRQRRGERGNAVIEFALGFSLLWACFAGVFQWGYSMYIYNGLETAVRNAAFVAAKADFNVTNGGTSVTTLAKNMAVYGHPDGTGTPLLPNLTTQNISVSYVTNAGVPSSITVAITGYSVNTVFKTFNFTNKPSVTAPYSGAMKY